MAHDLLFFEPRFKAKSKAESAYKLKYQMKVCSLKEAMKKPQTTFEYALVTKISYLYLKLQNQHYYTTLKPIFILFSLFQSRIQRYISLLNNCP